MGRFDTLIGVCVLLTHGSSSVLVQGDVGPLESWANSSIISIDHFN